MDEQRKQFPVLESTPGEDVVKSVEIITKDLENYRTLVGQAEAVSERIGYSSERSSAVGKMLSNSITCYREIMWEELTEVGNLHCCFNFSKCHSHPNLQQPPP